MGNESVGNGGRGGVVIHGDNSGVVSVGDRNVNVQSKPSGSASPKASVAASGQAPQAVPAWRFLIRENETLTTKVKATLVITTPQGRVIEYQPIEIKVPKVINDYAWYFGDRLSGTDPTRASRVESDMTSAGEEMLQAILTEDGSRAQWREALNSRGTAIWQFQGGATFQQLPWELLRDYLRSTDIARMYPMQRRVVKEPKFEPRVPADGPLSILWVTARAKGDRISNDAVVKPVRDEIQRRGEDVVIDWIADGNYETMLQHLNAHQRRPVYHVLHLDMHGGVASRDDVLASAAVNPDGWEVRDRAGRGAVQAGASPEGFVGFSEKGKVDPAFASELALEVSRAGIGVVVLNACVSALVPSSDETSLASALVEAGGFSALGFHRPVTVAGAVRFFTEMYRSLVASADRGHFDEAILAGRQALHSRRTRGTRELSDWSLPVWYVAQDFAATGLDDSSDKATPFL